MSRQPVIDICIMKLNQTPYHSGMDKILYVYIYDYYFDGFDTSMYHIKGKYLMYSIPGPFFTIPTQSWP